MTAAVVALLGRQSPCPHAHQFSMPYCRSGLTPTKAWIVLVELDRYFGRFGIQGGRGFRGANWTIQLQIPEPPEGKH